MSRLSNWPCRRDTGAGPAALLACGAIWQSTGPTASAGAGGEAGGAAARRGGEGVVCRTAPSCLFVCQRGRELGYEVFTPLTGTLQKRDTEYALNEDETYYNNYYNHQNPRPVRRNKSPFGWLSR